MPCLYSYVAAFQIIILNTLEVSETHEPYYAMCKMNLTMPCVSVCPFITISSWLGYIVSNKHCLLTIFASTVCIWSRCFVYPTGFNFADILCMVWRCAWGLDIMLIFFLHVLTRVNLVHFASIIYVEWVSCVCNSSYRFRPICLKLC